MTEEETKIANDALAYAKANKKAIAEKLTDINIFPADIKPVSVFMAGSPGAGKTEASQSLIEKLSSGGHPVLRIDTDEIRKEFSAYNGKNSRLFQGATSIIAERMHDIALLNKQSFVFDGTLSNFEKAQENILRSLNKKRFVQIIYVYQDPKQAWEFVKAREKKDGRHVPCEAFISQYFQARENVNQLKVEFGDRIKVDLVVKNMDGTNFFYRENIEAIDSYIKERYTTDTLREIIVE